MAVLTCRAVIISKLRRAGRVFSDGAIAIERNQLNERDRLMITIRTDYIIGGNKGGISAIDSRACSGWQAAREGRTIVMGNGLVSNRGGEMVGEDLKGTTFVAIAGPTDANCLNMVGDVDGGTTASAAAGSGATSTSSRWWSTATTTAADGWGRGTGGHRESGCRVWRTSTEGKQTQGRKGRGR